jgi:predicted porin
MKKTLVAIAALAATGAFAQTSVTLYGNLDQAVYGAKQSNTQQVLSSASNAGSTSAWGLKGTEDLCNGRKAEFNLLSELTLMTGQTSSGSTATTTSDKSNAQSTTFNRGAWVGLSDAKLGNVKLGRQNDALWESAGKYNNTGINSFGWNNLTAAATGFSTAASTFNGVALSTANAYGTNCGSTCTTPATYTNHSAAGSSALPFVGGISYETPTVAGFTGKYFSSAKTTYGDLTSELARKSMSLNYANGPLTASVAQSTLNDGNGDLGAKVELLGAAYTMGAFKFTVGQQKTKYSNAWVAANDLDVTGFGVGYTQGQMEYNLGLTTMKDKEDSTYKTTQTGLTARYNMSKRTSVYAGYGNSSNKGASNKQGVVYGGAALGVAGNNSAYLVGIKHSF